MRTVDIITLLTQWDLRGRFLYTTADLSKLLAEKSPHTFNTRLRRLVTAGILRRMARGVYLFAQSAHIDGAILEAIAQTLRRGAYNFVSYESALSEYGVISQVPIDRLTVATTGRRGEYRTPYGAIEFTHTERDPASLMSNTLIRDGRLLPLATQDLALQQLRRSGRNLDMIGEL